MKRRTRIAVLAAVLTLAMSLAVPGSAFALDGYERIGLVPPFDWDNYAEHATTISSIAGTQLHTFETLDPAFVAHDEDWLKFDATEDTTYYMQAYPMAGSIANPVIVLWNQTHSQMIAISDDAVLGENLARIAWTCRATGTYYLQVVDWYGLGTPAQYRVDVTLRGGIDPWPANRPQAPDRYTLAANLARAGWPGLVGITDVVVACGADRTAADPLAASGLAGVYNAPILLVQNDPTRVAVPAVTVQALDQIRSANGGVKPQIHVVGGPASVTAGHVNVLKAYDKDGVVERIGGADRYEVAAGIAAKMRSKLGSGYPKTAIYCNGHDAQFFWNALAAGPIAYRQHFPILLTTMSGIPAKTAAQKSFYTTKYVFGTPADTYPSVLAALGAMRVGWDTSDGPGYHRILVARRIVEGAADADWIGFGDSLSFGHLAFANKLADSLVGGSFAGRMNGGLLFTYNEQYLDQPWQHAWYAAPATDPNSDFLLARRDIGAPGTVWILGGNASVTEPVRAKILTLLGTEVP